jgi:hypothetical protein
MFEIYQFKPAIALALNSSDKAFIVEFIRWSVLYKAEKPEQYSAVEGKFYTWDTQDAWQIRMPWLSTKTIWRHMKALRDMGLIEAEPLSPDRHDRTLSYTINFEMYGQIVNMHLVKMSKSDLVKMSISSSSECPNLHTNTHTKTLTKTLSPHKDLTPFDSVMAKRWLDYNRVKAPNGRFNELKFAEAMMKMRTKFQMSEQDIEGLLNWIQNDDFYNKISPSPVGLLRKSPSDPDLTKLEVVIKQIVGRKKSKSERVMDSILKTEGDIEPDYNPLRLK